MPDKAGPGLPLMREGVFCAFDGAGFAPAGSVGFLRACAADFSDGTADGGFPADPAAGFASGGGFSPGIASGGLRPADSCAAAVPTSNVAAAEAMLKAMAMLAGNALFFLLIRMMVLDVYR
ncbi:MAG: hypothetical protein H7X91_12145 [Burkholderiales bacterium]|nr:hypothetical protein [Burkholderiales bacterium]